MLVSELAIRAQSVDDRSVVLERLIDVARVGDELGPLLLRRRLGTLLEALLLGDQEAAKLLGEEDVVDLDVVRRHPAVEE